MNKKGYIITCSKCESSNVKYDYLNTIMQIKDSKAITPVKCLDCGYETIETK